MTIVPIGDYRPDVPAYLGTHATQAANIYPREDGSDGPLRSPIALTTTISTGVVYGAFTCRSVDGTSYTVAGTAAAVWWQNGTGWTNGSGASAPYSASAATPWRFSQWGQTVHATNYADPIQASSMGGTFADLAGSPPRAKFMATVEPGFVMLGFINDGSERGSTVRWSEFNDATSWPTIGTSAAAAAQSDEQDLPNGGAIMGLQPAVGGAAAAIWTAQSIYRVEYTGAPTVFAFREISRGSGCMCPNGTVTINGVAYYVSEEGFQTFDGQAERAIGFARTSATFLNELDDTQTDKVWATVDPIRKLIIWAYPRAGSTYPDRWFIYNYATDKWRYANATDIACQLLFPARSAGYNLDTIDTVLGVPDTLGGYSFDSPLYNGGRRLLAGFDTGGRLVSYEGTTLSATVETGETDASGKRVFVYGIRPLTDAASPRAAVGTRDGFDETPVYTTYTTPGADAVCPQRRDTRYARAIINIAAGETWTYLQGADVVLRAAGKR